MFLFGSADILLYLGGFSSYEEAMAHIRSGSEERDRIYREQEQRKDNKLSIKSYATQSAFRVDEDGIYTALFGVLENVDSESVQSVLESGETGYYVLLYKTPITKESEKRRYGASTAKEIKYSCHIGGNAGSFKFVQYKWVPADVASSITDDSSFANFASSLYGGMWKEGFCNERKNEDYLKENLWKDAPRGGVWDIQIVNESDFTYKEVKTNEGIRLNACFKNKKPSRMGIGYIEYTLYDSDYLRCDAFELDLNNDMIYGAVLIAGNNKAVVTVYSIKAYEKDVALIEEGWTEHSFSSDVAEIEIEKTFDCPFDVVDDIFEYDDSDKAFADYLGGVVEGDWEPGAYYSEENASKICDRIINGLSDVGNVFDGYYDVPGYYVSWNDNSYDYTLDY